MSCWICPKAGWMKAHRTIIYSRGSQTVDMGHAKGLWPNCWFVKLEGPIRLCASNVKLGAGLASSVSPSLPPCTWIAPKWGVHRRWGRGFVVQWAGIIAPDSWAETLLGLPLTSSALFVVFFPILLTQSGCSYKQWGGQGCWQSWQKYGAFLGVVYIELQPPASIH